MIKAKGNMPKAKEKCRFSEYASQLLLVGSNYNRKNVSVSASGSNIKNVCKCLLI